MRYKCKSRFGPAALSFLITSGLCLAQVTVGVGSGSVIAGGPGSENISLSATSGNAPASVQWTLTYSGTDLSGMSLVPAAAVTAAGKALLCETSSGSVECVMWGTNTSPIPNGTIATANFDVSTSAATSSALLITGVVASSPSATSLPADGLGATLTLVHLSTVACNPNTLITPATASCTVNLTSASPSAVTVALGQTSSIAEVTMPGSISIPAGYSSSNFEVEVSAVAAPTTAIIVASLDGASVSFTLSLQPSSNQAPVISAVTAKSVTSSSATISWTTNEASTSQVAYGTTSAYGSTSVLGATLVTSHSVTLSGLAKSTTYHYQVLSRDGQGNLTSSGDFTLKTKH